MLNYVHMNDWTYEAIKPQLWAWPSIELDVPLPVIWF